MIRKISHEQMGGSHLGWLDSIFHFSFAEYYNPNNIHFGALRVINDDVIQAGEGFGTHPHKNMEIISYVIDGELTHKDSMGNERSVSRGNVQYMSAGTGITHSEYNNGEVPTRLLQIWFLPYIDGYTPRYGDYDFDWNERVGKWLHIVSDDKGSAPIHIHQDVNIYVTEIENETITFKVDKNRQAYIVQIEGNSIINTIPMNAHDGMEVIEEELTVSTGGKSHIMILEMARE